MNASVFRLSIRRDVIVMALAVALVFSPVCTLVADVPETGAARRLFFSDEEAVRADSDDSRRILSAPGRPDVILRTETRGDTRYHLFMPTTFSDGPLADGPGTWIIRERVATESFDQITIHLQRTRETYARIEPEPGGAYISLDLVLGGTDFASGVRLPMTMNRAIQADTREIIEATAGFVEWSIAFPDSLDPGYRSVERLVAELRGVEGLMADGEDGALDERGRLVSIETQEQEASVLGLNRAGFAKWVVDGLYLGRTGRLLPIAPLREKHSDVRGTRWSRRVEAEYDPYFGLDWTRNIARELFATAEGIPSLDLEPEVRDVRTVPFVRYREDIGYPIDSIEAVMYWVATQDPGSILLASVNEAVSEDDGLLRQHRHVAVLMPYFDSEGRFHPVVFEHNRETGPGQLARAYPTAFVHLVQVDAQGPYRLPPIPFLGDPTDGILR